MFLKIKPAREIIYTLVVCIHFIFSSLDYFRIFGLLLGKGRWHAFINWDRLTLFRPRKGVVLDTPTNFERLTFTRKRKAPDPNWASLFSLLVYQWKKVRFIQFKFATVTNEVCILVEALVNRVHPKPRNTSSFSYSVLGQPEIRLVGSWESKVLTDQVTNWLDLFALSILLFSSIFADDINVVRPRGWGTNGLS